MKFTRYEYEIKQGKEIIIGSFTLNENANTEIVTKLNAKKVEKYEIEKK